MELENHWMNTMNDEQDISKAVLEDSGKHTSFEDPKEIPKTPSIASDHEAVKDDDFFYMNTAERNRNRQSVVSQTITLQGSIKEEVAGYLANLIHKCQDQDIASQSSLLPEEDLKQAREWILTLVFNQVDTSNEEALIKSQVYTEKSVKLFDDQKSVSLL